MAMHEDWIRFLNETAPAALRHSSPAEEEASLEAARSGVFLCDLSSYALASVLGPDAEPFLQGQLSNDVKSLTPSRVQLAAYNTPKGRMLASLMLWRMQDDFLLQFPESIAPPFIKRLSMFVLRSKVRVTDVSGQRVRFGLGGPHAEDCLRAAGIACPASDFDMVRTGSTEVPDERLVIRLPGPRYELVYAQQQDAIRDWNLLSASATVALASSWRWLGVRSGIAEIEAATQDKYVPQMVNLELVGGISFTKGCYPGQEIVARTQYRGEIKRRMFLAHIGAGLAPTLGQEVVAVSAASQTVGSIVDFAPAPGGGHDVLACLHLELAHNGPLRLGTADGPALELLSLPYSLPQAL